VANWRAYSNNAVADTLVRTGGGNLTTGDTSISAGSGAPVGYPGTFPFILNLEPGTANFELVLVVSGAGTVASPWIITRAADGTTAKTHTAGTPIAHTMSAFDLTTAATHEAMITSGSGAHGLPAAAWLGSNLVTFATTTTTAAQTVIAGTNGTTVGSWSAIPATSKHLLITGTGRITEAAAYSDDLQMIFNGDSSSVYSYMTMFAANPAGVLNGWVPGTGFSLAAAPLFRLMASGFGSGVNAGGGFAVIPNYSGAIFNKVFYAISGGGDGTSSFMDLRVRTGVWNPAVQAAISAVAITAPSTGYVTGSVFGLYGFG
jgi:hypothetical protein